jgi:hypothetical protein
MKKSGSTQNVKSRCAKALLIALLIAMTTFHSPQASALTYDQKTFAKMMFYGFLTGTLMGTVVYSTNQNLRSIFLGSSVGIYLGSTVGLYHLTHRHDPENPLSPESAEWQIPPSSTIPVLSSFDQKMNQATPASFKIGFLLPILRF